MPDQLPAAIHEVGHALVQSVLTLGPREVVIFRRDDGQWGGQSRLHQSADGDENCAKRLVTQLAGPIAQVCCSPQSLGKWSGLFRGRILDPAIDVMNSSDGPLRDLLWESDLVGCHLLNLAAGVQTAREYKCAREIGGFLFEAELILFRAFQDSSIQREVIRVAKSLSDTESLTEAEFAALSAPALGSPVWTEIENFDFSFPPPLTSKK